VKVLHVIPAVAPAYGGPSRVIVEMCQALRELGLEVLIVTTDADGTGRLPVPLGKPTSHQGVPALFFPRQLSEAFKYSRPLAAWLQDCAGDFDLAHIHAVFSHSSLAAARACERAGIPYIVRPCGALDPWSRAHKRFGKKVLWALGVQRMLQGAAAIHYTTAAEENCAAGLGLAAGVVLPVGVDGQLFCSDDGESTVFRRSQPTLRDNSYVLTLSRLHPKKGLEVLLDAFLDVTRNGPLQKWRLVIAGDGAPEYVESLRNRARSRGGQERVLFPGWLDGPSRIAALREAALFALTSYQENFGIAVAEALACRVPVVVSDRVGLADEIKKEDAGWVVALEPEALRKQLAAALMDGSARARRGYSGYELASRRFRWPIVAQDVKRLYESVHKQSTNQRRGTPQS